jgi:hypothetical protein
MVRYLHVLKRLTWWCLFIAETQRESWVIAVPTEKSVVFVYLWQKKQDVIIKKTRSLRSILVSFSHPQLGLQNICLSSLPTISIKAKGIPFPNYEYQSKRYYFYMNLQTFHIKLTSRSRMSNSFSFVSLCLLKILKLHYWVHKYWPFQFKCKQNRIKIILQPVTGRQTSWVQLVCKLKNLHWYYTASLWMALYGQNIYERQTNWFAFIFILCNVPVLDFSKYILQTQKQCNKIRSLHLRFSSV